MRVRAHSSMAIGASILVLTAACGGGGSATETTDNSAPEASQKTESETSEKELNTFFRAVTEGDSDDIEGVRNLVMPNSLADAYLDYLVQSEDVEIDSGFNAFTDTEYKREGDVWQACPTDGQSECVGFANVETESGQIADFTVNDVALADKLVSGDGSTTVAGDLAEVEFLTASKTTTGALVVIYKITSKAESVTLGNFEVRYRDPGGRQSTASVDSAGPDDLAADSSATVLSVFPKAKPGGEVTVPIFSENFDESTAKFDIK